MHCNNRLRIEKILEFVTMLTNIGHVFKRPVIVTQDLLCDICSAVHYEGENILHRLEKPLSSPGLWNSTSR